MKERRVYMREFTGSEKIGEIVAAFPGASNLFKANSVDFCCGGNRILSTVLAEKRINPEQFLHELNEAYQEAIEREKQPKDWRDAPFAELIEYIIDHHHGYLYRELPILSEFVTKIFRVHGTKHPELGELHKRFHELKLELEQHLVEEEQVVFPLIKDFAEKGSLESLEQALKAIKQLEDEHERAGDLLKEMNAITDQYRLPPGACTTYRVTFQKLQQLEADLFQHVHLENNILFPRLERVSKTLKSNEIQ